jgi:hypothetical protein
MPAMPHADAALVGFAGLDEDATPARGMRITAPRLGRHPRAVGGVNAARRGQRIPA